MNKPTTAASRLAQVTVKTPCFEDWSQMSGDERERLCGKCNKRVYNLKELTEQDALALLGLPNPACVRLFRRHDGTVLTKECASGRNRRWRMNSMIAATIAALVAPFGIKASSAGSANEPGEPTMGEVVMEPPVKNPIYLDSNSSAPSSSPSALPAALPAAPPVEPANQGDGKSATSKANEPKMN